MDSPDTQMIREAIAAVLEDQCESREVHEFTSGHNDLAKDLWREAVSLGWIALALPEDNGGLGMGASGSSVLHYELGRVVAPGPFIATCAALDILANMADASAASLVERVLAGEATLAVEAARPTSTRAAGLGPMRLLGDVDAAAALVSDGDDLLLLDITAMHPTRYPVWDQTRAIVQATGDAGEPMARLPGARARLEQALALALAADCAGLARGIADRTIAYMKEREQFGKPIGSFQALKHRAANLRARSLVADHVVAHSVEQADAGVPHAATWAKLAKVECSEAAVFVSGDCIQLHGGVGFTDEYDPHLYAKRARLNEALLMSNLQLLDGAAAEFEAAVASDADIMELAR